jgi:hypothetical protein
VSNWLYSYDWCQAPAPTLAPSRSRNADEHQPRPLGLASAQLGTILDQASAVCWGPLFCHLSCILEFTYSRPGQAGASDGPSCQVKAEG